MDDPFPGHHQLVPNAVITGFNKPRMAIEYAKVNRIDLAFLDVEMGTASDRFCDHAGDIFFVLVKRVDILEIPLDGKG